MRFESASTYIQGASTIAAKITAIDNIIDALLVTAADSASNDGIKEYMLNDGQTVIREEYTGVNHIMESINAFNKLRTYYENRANGRVTRMVPGLNFKKYR